jgi:hypothetical protein
MKKFRHFTQVVFLSTVASLSQILLCFLPGLDDACAQLSQSVTSLGDTAAEKADDYHQRGSEMLLTTAEWLDSFFQTENYSPEINKTYMRIRLDGFKEEGESADGRVRFRLRLDLPGTENRLGLILGSDPDVIDTLDDSPVDSDRDQFEDDTKNGILGLEYFGLDSDKVNLKFSGGVRYRDSRLVEYGSVRFRYYKPFDDWAMRFTERLRYYTDDGWESRTDVDLERPIGGKMFLRVTPSLEWLEIKGKDDDEEEIGYDNEGGFYYNLVTSLYHPISRDLALEYQFNNYFDTELSGQLLESNLRVRLRQRLWREWLVLEVAPQVAWYEARDFDTVFGILVRLEIYLGRYKREAQEVGWE